MDGVVVVIQDGDEYLMVQDASGSFEGNWSPVHGSLEEGKRLKKQEYERLKKK